MHEVLEKLKYCTSFMFYKNEIKIYTTSGVLVGVKFPLSPTLSADK